MTSAPLPAVPPARVRLGLLPYDILLQIRQIVKCMELEENHPEPLVKPLKRFSLVNKAIRDICLPILLSNLCLAGFNGTGMNWIPSFQKIMRRDNGSRAGTHVRYTSRLVTELCHRS